MGTQATCGKQPRLAPWSRDQPALSGTPDSCGFPEGNNRVWQRNQPGLSPWRRGSRQLPSWAGSLADSPRRTTAG
jgi:hypothetical protein